MCCPLSQFVWGVEHFDASYHYQMELFKALDVMPKLINVRYVLFPIVGFIFFACGKLLAHLDLKNTVDFLDKAAYLIIVIFFTLTQFLENKIYTEKRRFFALNL